MSEDAEIRAMTTLTEALVPLDEITRGRVLSWATMRFAGSVLGDAQTRRSAETELTSPSEFNDFAELFSASDPRSEKEKALVGAYWIQVVQNQPNFAAQSVNSILKDLGHGLTHITDALEALKDEKPALALQLKKSGTSKQARKTYKLTQEGIKRVKQMLERKTDE